MTIRIVIASNFRLMLASLEALLRQYSDRFDLAGSLPTFDDWPRSAASTGADLLLLDLDSAPETAPTLIAAALNVARPMRILLLTRLDDAELQDQAILAGARGVIDRSVPPALFMDALEKVHQGEMWLNRSATARIFHRVTGPAVETTIDPLDHDLNLLTEREREIITYIAANHTEPGKTIARRLNIGEGTLRNHMTSIYAKLGVVNSNGLIAYVFRNRLAERLQPISKPVEHSRGRQPANAEEA